LVHYATRLRSKQKTENPFISSLTVTWIRVASLTDPLIQKSYSGNGKKLAPVKTGAVTKTNCL
jgi:hypothetical protein